MGPESQTAAVELTLEISQPVLEPAALDGDAEVAQPDVEQGLIGEVGPLTLMAGRRRSGRGYRLVWLSAHGSAPVELS